jgi:hypothetical protein
VRRTGTEIGLVAVGVAGWWGVRLVLGSGYHGTAETALIAVGVLAPIAVAALRPAFRLWGTSPESGDGRDAPENPDSRGGPDIPDRRHGSDGRVGRDGVGDDTSGRRVDLGAAADAPAERVERQWRPAADQDRSPGWLPDLRWTWSARGGGGSALAAAGDPGHPRFAPLPGLPRIEAGELAGGSCGALFRLYGGLDSGRIVLTGAPGSGKSSTMVRLLLDALAHRAVIRDP